MQIENTINHFFLVLDRSSSMSKYKKKVVEVTDRMVRNLAIKSTELEQETRITIVTFSDPGQRKVLVWDKDVLRMPSIEGLYEPYGWTALVEATCETLDDMELIPVIYGSHAHAGWVISDGLENSSRDKLALKYRKLRDDFTLGALVPDESAKYSAISLGFAAENIDIWDATSEIGVEAGFSRVERSATNFMETRKKSLGKAMTHICSFDTYTGNKDGPFPDGRYLYLYQFKCSCGATSWRTDS